MLHIIITGPCQLLPWHSLANIRHVFNFENYHPLKRQCSLCIGCLTEFGTQSIMTILSSLFSVNSYPGCKHCLADIRHRRCVFQLQNYPKTNQQRSYYIGYFVLFFGRIGNCSTNASFSMKINNELISNFRIGEVMMPRQKTINQRLQHMLVKEFFSLNWLVCALVRQNLVQTGTMIVHQFILATFCHF